MGTPILDQGMQWWCGKEATFGAGPASAPSATDAFIHEAIDLGNYPSPAHYAIGDKTGFQSFRPDIAGPVDPLALQIQMAARPAGSAAAPPQYGALLEAGGFAQSAGSYVPSFGSDDTAWLWGANRDGTVGHCFTGVAVQQIVYSGGDQHARLQFTAQAARGAVVYRTKLAAAASIGATSLQLEPGHGWVILGAPAWVKIGSQTVKVTGVNGNTATVAALTAAASSGDDVIPAFFDRVENDSDPVAEQDLLVDIDGGAEDIYVTTFELTIATGRELRAKESNSRFRRGVISTRPAERVTFQAELIYDTDAAKLHAYVAALAQKELLARIGPSGGRRIEFSCPHIQLKPFAAPEGAEGARMATITGRAYALDGADITISYL